MWAKLSHRGATGRPRSTKLTAGLIGLLLLGGVYVAWNPIASDAAYTAPAAAPTVEAQNGYFLRAYQDPAAEAPPTINGWAVVLDTGLKLLLVVGLIYLTAWGLRAVFRHTRLAAAPTGSIGVLESTNLAPNRSLHLVAVGGKVLLLGGTPTQLSLLTEFTDPEVVRDLRGETGFARHLEASSASLERQETEPIVQQAVDGADFLRERIQEIQQISRRFGRRG